MSKLHELTIALLKCVEYNAEKLEAHFFSKSTPAEFQQVKLEMDISLGILAFTAGEKFHWDEPEIPPSLKKLITDLVNLINNTQWELSPEDRILYLKGEINEAVLSLREIKKSMKSKTLQKLETYLNEILKKNI